MTEQRERATGRSWWISADKPQGGFALIREEALYSAWASLQRGEIVLRDFRVWLASFEVVERRIGLPKGRTPEYGETEFRRLVGGVGGEHIRASFRRLQSAGLGEWAQNRIVLLGSRRNRDSTRGRWVPIPRRMLRDLSHTSGRAVIATALGHILRCLFFRNNTCISGGYCKSSWIADCFGVALRSVKTARQELLRNGFLKAYEIDQTRLNRFGSAITVNLSWSAASESAPPCRISTTETAPLSKHINLSYRRTEHQKPGHAPGSTGFFKKGREAKLHDIQEDDLCSSARLVILFRQAERKMLVKNCEADKLAFLSLAEHAKRVAVRNAPGLFSSLLRKGYFAYISSDDEERGRRRFADIRERSIA